MTGVKLHMRPRLGNPQPRLLAGYSSVDWETALIYDITTDKVVRADDFAEVTTDPEIEIFAVIGYEHVSFDQSDPNLYLDHARWEATEDEVAYLIERLEAYANTRRN